MNKPSKNLLKEVDDFFSREPTTNQKAWGLIHDFYHLVLTYMENKKISKSDLAQRLGKSRSAITQMFNKTPNISIKKMVEIADAVGIEISIRSEQLEAMYKEEEIHAVSDSPVVTLSWPLSASAMPLSKGEGKSGIFINSLNPINIIREEKPSADIVPVDPSGSTQAYNDPSIIRH